jgi:hypothetical protein
MENDEMPIQTRIHSGTIVPTTIWTADDHIPKWLTEYLKQTNGMHPPQNVVIAPWKNTAAPVIHSKMVALTQEEIDSHFYIGKGHYVKPTLWQRVKNWFRRYKNKKPQ